MKFSCLPWSAASVGRRVLPRRLALLCRVLVVSLFVSACASPPAAPPVSGLLRPPPAAASVVASGVTTIPGLLPFPIEQNVGQAGPNVSYLLRAGAMKVGFGAGELMYVLDGASALATPGKAGWQQDRLAPATADLPTPTWTVKQELVGASRAMPSGTVGSPTAISYFKGPAEQWLVDVPAFEQVAYTEAWPGITVTYERGAGGPKSAYQVAAGADPGRIRLLYSGARVRVDERGALVAETPLGELRESPPIAWQERDGTRAAVEARYELLGEPEANATEYGFALGAYDPALPLVIDPQLTFAGYIGGPGLDQGRAIALDGSGNIYVTGLIDVGATFPGSPGTFDNSQNGDWDAYAVKLNPAGTSMVYAGFIGGSGKEIGFGIAVDGSGNAYISGLTSSSEATFPSGGGIGALATFDGTYNGSTGGIFSGDAFAVKLNAAGTALLYAGYIGGSSDDQAAGIAIDAAGNAYISGFTESSQATFPNGNGMGSLPTIDGAYNGAVDAFVAKINAAGTALVYASYIGGSGYDQSQGIVVDAAGNVYLAGRTESSEATFPTGSGMGTLTTFFRTYSGASDVFLIKINPAGTGIVYVGYIGGSAADKGGGLAIDAAGNAYVTGSIEGAFAPTLLRNASGGAIPLFDSTFNGAIDGFVVKVNPAGTGLVYAGYIGGDSADAGLAIAVDQAGSAYVVGHASSTEFTFPNGNGFGALPTFDSTNNTEGDGFVAKIRADGSALEYAGYLGGNGTQVLSGTVEFGIELGIGIVADQAGNAYIAGRALSTEVTFPDGLGMTGMPTFDGTYGGGLTDAFVVKITPGATCALAGRQAAGGLYAANTAWQYAYYDYLTTGSLTSYYALVYLYQSYVSSQAGSTAHTSGNYASAKANFNTAATYAYYGYQYAYASYLSTSSQYANFAFYYGHQAQAHEYQAYVSC